MSFGLEDEDWVDPDDEETRCDECGFWHPCPCGCGFGWCDRDATFADADDGCGA